AGVVSSAADTVKQLRVAERTVLVADPAMVSLYGLVERLAATDLPVLVCGETGAGKEIVSTAIHAWSKRASKALVALNCAANAESLLESELFGHEKGAFTGATSAKVGLLESATDGTLFLDEIGELSATAQAKLLRFLETRRFTRLGSVRETEIDVRIIAATN